MVKTGGMGSIYEATDETLPRTVAIKVIRPELAGDAGFRARFKREAAAVAQLNHRNIIAIHGFGEDDELLYIVMPFVGSDLGALLRQRGRLDIAAAIEVVRQIARALDAAHAAGLVHRDVKPANLLVGGELPDADLLLTDFGLTSAFDARSDETMSGAILGTLDYMAPEYLMGALPGRQGDIYALGVVLYELLTGSVPFAGEDRETRLAAAQRGDHSPPPLRELAPGTPAELDEVIARALHRDPGERYASAGELAQAAADAIATGEVAGRHDALFISHSQRDGREFAQRLARALRSGPEPLAVWLEAEQLEPGRQQEAGEKVRAAIKRSRALLFVLTRDSARPGSSCQDDWERALKHGKPVIPIGAHDDAELPFRLGSRAIVDFGTDFDEGVRLLRRQLTATNTDEGRLRQWRHRLADLERERRFAEPADQPRLDRAISEVERSIEQLARQDGDGDGDPPGPPTREPEPASPPSRGRRARAVIACCGVLATVALAFVLGREWGAPASNTDIVVDFSYSLGGQKEALLGPLIERFNRERHTIGGRAVRVVADNSRTSGDQVRMIAEQTLTPAAWAPSDISWGAKLNYIVTKRARRSERWVTADPTVLMSSATTIAMWESQLTALGGQGRPIGWKDVLGLATDGWESVGRRDLGPFKFVHPSPETSTTGLQATVAEYQFAAGTQGPLSLEDIDGEEVRSKVRSIESAIEHYGDSAVDTEDRLAAEGSNYASIVALGEVAVLGVNRKRQRAGKEGRLVAVYPAGGMFLREEPFYVVKAPWTDVNERRGAEMLRRYLQGKITPAVAMAADYRPGKRNATKPRQFVERWRELGVDLDLDRNTEVLTMPEPQVLEAIEKHWQEDRKPARLQVVIDTSRAMGDSRLNRAIAGLEQLLDDLAPQDQIGLITAAQRARLRVGLGRTDADRLRQVLEELQPGGKPVPYDATGDAVRELASPRSDKTIDAVVLLTSGEDTASGTTYDQLLATLRRERHARHPIRLFTVLYAPDRAPPDPDSDAGRAAAKIAALAEATGGKAYVDHGETSLTAVYRAIAPSY